MNRAPTLFAAVLLATASIAAARDHGEQWTLANAARTAYEAAFARRNQKLPRLGATATVVSFTDLPAKLASGDIDAVLSSGDGGDDWARKAGPEGRALLERR